MVQEIKQEVTKVVSLVKMVENYEGVSIHLKPAISCATELLIGGGLPTFAQVTKRQTHGFRHWVNQGHYDGVQLAQCIKPRGIFFVVEQEAQICNSTTSPPPLQLMAFDEVRLL